MSSSTVLIALMLIASVSTIGCSRNAWLGAAGGAAAVGAGIAGYQYLEGDLEADLDSDLEDVFDASREALVANGYNITDQDLQANEASIEATGMAPDGEEKDVNVSLEETGAGTSVQIRFGVFGDEEASAQLLQDIRSRV